MDISAIKTKKGYGFMPCASALQKAIRRGEEDIALYFMVELFNSGYDEYVWKRLKIITCEDVGLAEPNAPAIIHGLYEMYLDQKKKKDEKNKPERLFITQAIIYLTRCKKSRLIDWTLITVWGEHDGKEVKIPDYAYDKHNQEGRKMGRGVDHFFQEGTILLNQVAIPGESEMRENAYQIMKNPPKEVLSPVLNLE